MIKVVTMGINEMIHTVFEIYHGGEGMGFSKEELVHIADQSRLHLTEEDSSMYVKDVQDILSFTAKIHEINTDGVKPTTNGKENHSRKRNDVAVNWDYREEALNHAPDHDGEHINVPPIMA